MTTRDLIERLHGDPEEDEENREPEEDEEIREPKDAIADNLLDFYLAHSAHVPENIVGIFFDTENAPGAAPVWPPFDVFERIGRAVWVLGDEPEEEEG